MSPLTRFLRAVGGRRSILGLGGAYVLIAVAWPFIESARGGSFQEELIVSILTGGAGVLLFYGAYRLPRTDIRPKFYTTVASWCFRAAAVMVGIIVFIALVAYLNDPANNFLILPALAAVAGFAAGSHDARAKTRAYTLEQRNQELAKQAHQQQVVADLGQLALEVEDLDELMREATERVADVLDNEYCEVLELTADGEELLLRHGVGWDETSIGEATVSAVEPDSQAAYTLETEGPVVVEDFEADERFSGPEPLAERDVRSGVSTVIGSYDEPWGILGTHGTERREFTDEDVSFVQSVANILAEAIERRQYQSELEGLVADLEESNERLEQFAYAASHDLQEPLRMVSTYLQLIERRYEDELDDEGREFLEFAVDGADRMRAMIDGLLEYSRVETAADPLEPVELEAVLEDAREDLHVAIEASDATITADSLPRVEGDAHQLRQVFQNLFENAIEYSGDDPPAVRVSAERDGSHWTVTVRDDGIGIDPDDQEKVFDVFERAHGRSEGAGTGIGLALCERIVERHGGDIWLDSEPGSGTAVSFTLPAADEQGVRVDE